MPTRLAWLPNQVHAGLLRRAVGLARVARDAGADDVLPCGRAVVLPRYHVVEIQVARVEFLPAILAGVLVALKNIVPGELNLLARHTVVYRQKNHPREPQRDAHAVDAFRAGLALGKVGPLVEAEGVEVAFLTVDDLRVALEQHG